MNQVDLIQPIGGVSITQPKPNYMLTFHNEGKAVGSFDFNEGRMHFEGDVSESGQVFVDWVLNAFEQRIRDAVQAEREACAKLCEFVAHGSGFECARGIRYRSKGQA